MQANFFSTNKLAYTCTSVKCMCTRIFQDQNKKVSEKQKKKIKKNFCSFFLYFSRMILLLYIELLKKTRPLVLKLHAIYRTWQGLFPWALRCLLLSITKVHTCSSRKCIQCTRLKIPFHKFRKKLYIIYLVYLIIQVSSIFNGIYTTLLVRLFGYVTAVLLAIMNTS